MRKAVIILPTYNEVETIQTVIENLQVIVASLSKWSLDIIVVDSSSEDGTGKIVKELQKNHKNLNLIETQKLGLGKAYVEGFNYAIEHIKPYVILQMDSDLSHDSSKIPLMLKEIEDGADFVIGSRYIKGGSIPSDWGLHRKVFSIFGNMIIRMGFMKRSVTDWTGGYRAIKTWIIKNSLSHIENYSGYVFQIALLNNALQQNVIVKEIPIQFKDRTHGVSKINFSGYIVQIFKYILTQSSFIKFGMVGLTGFSLDFGISFLGISYFHFPVWIVTLVSTESAIIVNFFLNNFWSFNHKSLDKRKKTYILGFAKFNLISSGSVLTQTVLMELFTSIFGRTWWWVYKAGIIFLIIIPYSYFMYNKFVWKDK